jgi:site-specific recombinase XerD
MKREADVEQFRQNLDRRFPNRRTSKDYVSDLRQFMSACCKDWREVDMHDIDAFIDQQRQAGMKPATIKRRAAALKTFFDFLAEESGELNWPNPVRMKRHAGRQPRRLPRDLSDEAVAKVWQVIDNRRDQAWFALMLRAGLRVGEIASLKREDILAPAQAEQPGRLRVCGKGQKERVVLVTGDAYAVLQAWLEERRADPSENVFVNEREGGSLSVSGIEYCLKQYSQLAEVAITPHRLRHTYARQLTEAGMPITSLSKLMGHAQVSTTQIYTAGADPALAQAYQQAMQQVAQASLPPVTPTQLPPVSLATPSAPQAVQEPVLESNEWALHLPEEIRQGCLDFVKRRFPTWKARRRVKQAKRVLGELRHFWEWQVAARPIQRPGELTLRDIQAYQKRILRDGLLAITVDHELAYVVSLLHELADLGQVVDASVFRWKPRPRLDSLPRYLTEQEARRLETWTTEQLASVDPVTCLENVCLLLMLHAGLRAGECLDLTRSEVDLDHQRLTVRQAKGQRDRVVYFSNLTALALRRYLTLQPRPADAPLLVLPNGHPCSDTWLYLHTLAVGKASGVEHISPHRLRHTLATRLLNAGMEITRIQKLLGHEHVNTTMIYARVYDHTVEADYRHAMHSLELQQMPLSDQPIPVAPCLPLHNEVVNVRKPLDNSV